MIDKNKVKLLDIIGFVAQRFESKAPLIEPNLRRNLGMVDLIP
jgi:hypothetical protein